MPTLAPDDPARRWEPKTLRFRLLTVCARLITSGRTVQLHLPRHWPWTTLITTTLDRLHALSKPG